jgi:hypothetical protein
MAQPLCIDLFCGLGGWAEGFLSEGWQVIGFDIAPQPLYPLGAHFIQTDVRRLADLIEECDPAGWYGLLSKRVEMIVASPPCEEFSRHDQPWTRKRNPPAPDQSLWLAAERIAQCLNAPLLIENVRGAQMFIGPARWHFGKQYLWGDVPAIMPKVYGGQNYGRQKQSRSSSRKAERAKVPFELASHVARVFLPA